jgi:hypothetical protein
VNAYGFQGPWAERRGWEQLAQAATGLADLHSAGREKSALVPVYFNDYGSGYFGALGVLAALLRRADEGGSWSVRVALAKTAMLGTRFAENHEPAVPINDAELDRYLVDQASPIGLLTRVAPAIGLERSPAYVERRQLSRLLDARHRLGPRSNPAAPRASPADLHLSPWTGQAERSADL